MHITFPRIFCVKIVVDACDVITIYKFRWDNFSSTKRLLALDSRAKYVRFSCVISGGDVLRPNVACNSFWVFISSYLYQICWLYLLFQWCEYMYFCIVCNWPSAAVCIGNIVCANKRLCVCRNMLQMSCLIDFLLFTKTQTYVLFLVHFAAGVFPPF